MVYDELVPASGVGCLRYKRKVKLRMPDKPQIEKIRVLHDLQTQFNVSDAIRSTLESQLNNRDHVDRFVRGFRIEDWFEWIFSTMPWIKLIHGLDQQQFPSRSKENYQVPDFLLLVETSALALQPLLVEVKRVSAERMTLKLQNAQVELCQAYAAALKIPLVYAVYWEKVCGWTMNTVDSLEQKSSSYKLALTRAIELDCSAIVGDISHLVPPALVRVSRFSKNEVLDDSVRHEQYGRLLSDIAILGEQQVEMTSLESAAIDSMILMKRQESTELGNGETEVVESPDDIYLIKLSSWVTRHIAMFGVTPSERLANMSGYTITELMKKLDCPVVHLFPTGRTKELARMDEQFRTAKSEAIAGAAHETG